MVPSGRSGGLQANGELVEVLSRIFDRAFARPVVADSGGSWGPPLNLWHYSPHEAAQLIAQLFDCSGSTGARKRRQFEKKPFLSADELRFPAR